jgi:type VI protein secretion system component VasK
VNYIELGPWALFRLLKTGDFQSKGPNKFLASYLPNGRSVGLLITASSANNPFASNPLQGFNCQG